MTQLLSDPVAISAALFAAFVAGLFLGMMLVPRREPRAERDPKTGRYVKKR